MSCTASVSAPSTPTEQVKQIHNASTKKKAKHNNRVHFPDEELLVTCFLEPPDPWSKVYGNTLNTLISSYVASCDKQGIKPLPCVLDQLQEFESSSHKLNSNPRAFDLSILGEKLSMKHCEALEEVLRRLQFQLVDLEGCYLEDEGAAAFFDMIEYYDSAVQLNISFTKHIDCRGWQACSRMLKKTTSLVHLNARSTGLNEQVLLIIGRALRLGSNLVTLHLENCGIFGRCLVILVAALKLNTTMRELFLAENKISPADGFQLGNLLRTNTHLQLLDLSNNKLGDEGLTHVMDSLGQQSNTSGRGLYTLVLWNNELTAKGMPCISRALTAARALRKLNLGSNSITGAGVLELKQSLICNRTIEVLELENACITSTGVFAIAEYITQNQFIQKLDIRGNDIRLADLVALNQALEKNPNVISLLVDPTSMDLTEPIKERQQCLLEINKICQRNKEAKSSLPPQDAQLSILFNGIFSHVLPSPVPPEQPQNDFPKSDNNPPPPQNNTLKGRFRVSIVAQVDSSPVPQQNGVVRKDSSAKVDAVVKPPSQSLRSFSLDASYCAVLSATPKTIVAPDDGTDPERSSGGTTAFALKEGTGVKPGCNVIGVAPKIAPNSDLASFNPVGNSVSTFPQASFVQKEGNALNLSCSGSAAKESTGCNVLGTTPTTIPNSDGLSLESFKSAGNVPVVRNLINTIPHTPFVLKDDEDLNPSSSGTAPKVDSNSNVSCPETAPKEGSSPDPSHSGTAPKGDSNSNVSYLETAPKDGSSPMNPSHPGTGPEEGVDPDCPAAAPSGDGLVLDRVRWLEGLEQLSCGGGCSCRGALSEPLLCGLGDDSEVFAEGGDHPRRGRKCPAVEPCGGEPKVRRSSSPTMSTARPLCRKTRSIKCCKELESLDLRSTVPLSPTRLHEGFDFPDSQVSDVPLNSQMNIKSSHAVYMVH